MGGKKTVVSATFLFTIRDRRSHSYIGICSLAVKKLYSDDSFAGAEAKTGCIASSSTPAFSISLKEINTRRWISVFESMLVP